MWLAIFPQSPCSHESVTGNTFHAQPNVWCIAETSMFRLGVNGKFRLLVCAVSSTGKQLGFLVSEAFVVSSSSFVTFPHNYACIQKLYCPKLLCMYILYGPRLVFQSTRTWE